MAEVQAQNRLSSVTFADDYPVEEHSWVEFPVFGTKYQVRGFLQLYAVSVQAIRSDQIRSASLTSA